LLPGGSSGVVAGCRPCLVAFWLVGWLSGRDPMFGGGGGFYGRPLTRQGRLRRRAPPDGLRPPLTASLRRPRSGPYGAGWRLPLLMPAATTEPCWWGRLSRLGLPVPCPPPSPNLVGGVGFSRRWAAGPVPTEATTGSASSPRPSDLPAAAAPAYRPLAEFCHVFLGQLQFSCGDVLLQVCQRAGARDRQDVR